MGLKLEQLTGKLETVEILEHSQTEKDGKQIVVLKVEKDGNKFDVGLFGADVTEKILDKHGSEENGRYLLKIPASKIKEEGMIWITHPY